jgi:hypothetical protein
MPTRRAAFRMPAIVALLSGIPSMAHLCSNTASGAMLILAVGLAGYTYRRRELRNRRRGGQAIE